MEAGNLTSNSSGVMRHGRRSTKTLDYAIPYTVTSGMLSFVGGVSNLFVLFILLRYVRLKQNTYVYMFSLFLSDILYNCVVQPQVCYYQFPSAVITAFGRNYIHAASVVCILIGTSSLFFASLDQYIFIKHPFFYRNSITKRKTRVIVLGIWLVCLALGVARFHNIVLIKNGYLGVIATSFVLTILVQMMIFVIAREQDKRIQQLHRSLEHNHPRDDVGNSVVQSHASQSSNKAAKTVGLLLLVYIASWLPVNIYRQEYRWNGGDPIVYHKWVRIVNLMIQLHSCINPLIFVLRSKDMKNAVAKFLKALGVRHEWGSEVIVGSNGNHLIASTRACSNNVNIYEDDARNENHQRQEISDQRNGEILTAAESEHIEEHVSTSYRNSCGNNASGNTSDGPNNENSQGEHIADKNITLGNVGRGKQVNGNDNNLKTALNVNDSKEEKMVNDVSGNIQEEHIIDNKNITLGNVGRGEQINGNDNCLKTALNVNDSKEERMVKDVSGSIQSEENMESSDIRSNVNGINMLESQIGDINTRNNDSKGK